MSESQNTTTKELAIRVSIDDIADDDTLLIKTNGVNGRLYEQLTVSTGLSIIGDPGNKTIIATGESTPGAHHVTHEPGGGDEVGVIALRPLANDPNYITGKLIVYVLASDPYTIRVKSDDNKIRVLVLSDPIN